jgi:hypothetical protein
MEQVSPNGTSSGQSLGFFTSEAVVWEGKLEGTLFVKVLLLDWLTIGDFAWTSVGAGDMLGNIPVGESVGEAVGDGGDKTGDDAGDEGEFVGEMVGELVGERVGE